MWNVFTHQSTPFLLCLIVHSVLITKPTNIRTKFALRIRNLIEMQCNWNFSKSETSFLLVAIESHSEYDSCIIRNWIVIFHPNRKWRTVFPVSGRHIPYVAFQLCLQWIIAIYNRVQLSWHRYLHMHIIVFCPLSRCLAFCQFIYITRTVQQFLYFFPAASYFSSFNLRK